MRYTDNLSEQFSMTNCGWSRLGAPLLAEWPVALLIGRRFGIQRASREMQRTSPLPLGSTTITG